MIGRLVGTLVEKSPPGVLVDVGGVGYDVDVPMSSFYNLPAIGERVTLLTHFVVREDAQQLFGFLTAGERATFRQLVKISGIGPRMALAILSGLSVTELAQAVSQQDSGRLVKVPGIGKKTAERLLLELKDKLGADLVLPASAANDTQGDIVQALLALGYNEREAAAALKALPPDVGVSDGIKLALRALSHYPQCLCCAAAAGSGAFSTSSITSTSPAFSNRSTSGSLSPGLSGPFRPVIIRCSAPGLNSTRPRAGTSTAASSRMRITSPSMRIVCSSTRSATGVRPPRRRSGVAPALWICRKPPPVCWPGTVGRAQGCSIFRSARV
jgi:Holliday junction DNA helicase RuvA